MNSYNNLLDLFRALFSVLLLSLPYFAKKTTPSTSTPE